VKKVEAITAGAALLLSPSLQRKHGTIGEMKNRQSQHKSELRSIAIVIN